MLMYCWYTEPYILFASAAVTSDIQNFEKIKIELYYIQKIIRVFIAC